MTQRSMTIPKRLPLAEASSFVLFKMLTSVACITIYSLISIVEALSANFDNYYRRATIITK